VSSKKDHALFSAPLGVNSEHITYEWRIVVANKTTAQSGIWRSNPASSFDSAVKEAKAAVTIYNTHHATPNCIVGYEIYQIIRTCVQCVTDC
jgi:hypothetical protein